MSGNDINPGSCTGYDARVRALSVQGLEAPEIAERLGLSECYIHNIVKRLRKAGVLPKKGAAAPPPAPAPSASPPGSSFRERRAHLVRIAQQSRRMRALPPVTAEEAARLEAAFPAERVQHAAPAFAAPVQGR